MLAHCFVAERVGTTVIDGDDHLGMNSLASDTPVKTSGLRAPKFLETL